MENNLKSIEKSASSARNRSIISLFDLSLGMNSFFENECRGLGELSFSVDRDDYVNISVEATGYLLKLLFKYIRLESYITVNAEIKDDLFSFKITATPPISLSDDKISVLMKLSKSAGFRINITNDAIFLTTDIIHSLNRTYAIYARGPESICSTITRIFESEI